MPRSRAARTAACSCTNAVAAAESPVHSTATAASAVTRWCRVRHVRCGGACGFWLLWSLWWQASSTVSRKRRSATNQISLPPLGEGGPPRSGRLDGGWSESLLRLGGSPIRMARSQVNVCGLDHPPPGHALRAGPPSPCGGGEMYQVPDYRLRRCPHSTQKLCRPRLWCPHDGQTRRRGGSACSHRSFSRRYQIPSSGPNIQRRPSLSSTARSRTASRKALAWSPPDLRSSTRNL